MHCMNRTPVRDCSRFPLDRPKDRCVMDVVGMMMCDVCCVKRGITNARGVTKEGRM